MHRFVLHVIKNCEERRHRNNEEVNYRSGDLADYHLGEIFLHRTFLASFFCIAGKTRIEPDFTSRLIKIYNKNE